MADTSSSSGIGNWISGTVTAAKTALPDAVNLYAQILAARQAFAQPIVDQRGWMENQSVPYQIGEQNNNNAAGPREPGAFDNTADWLRDNQGLVVTGFALLALLGTLLLRKGG